MIIVHHLGISQSERILWLCEELGLPYELRRYDRNACDGLAPEEYKALHPAGTAPIISDGDRALPESGAIITYIIEKYADGRLALKPDHPNYCDYLFWFHYANGSMMPNLMMGGVLERAETSSDHAMVQWVKSKIARSFAMVEKRAAEAPYLAGDEFTAADIIMFFPLSTMRKFCSVDIADYPHLQAYLKRIAARPAYQAAMAKGDPGMTVEI